LQLLLYIVGVRIYVRSYAFITYAYSHHCLIAPQLIICAVCGVSYVCCSVLFVICSL